MRQNMHEYPKQFRVSLQYFVGDYILISPGISHPGWAPPHTVIRYTTLLITTPLAKMCLVLKVAFLAINYKPLILPVSCFIMDFLPSLIWWFHWRDWWRWPPSKVSVSVGFMVKVPASSFIVKPFRTHYVLSGLIASLFPLIQAPLRW